MELADEREVRSDFNEEIVSRNALYLVCGDGKGDRGSVRRGKDCYTAVENIVVVCCCGRSHGEGRGRREVVGK